MPKNLILTLGLSAALAGAFSASGCKKAPEQPAAPAAAQANQVYHGHGVVKGFQAEGRVIILKHEKIEGLMDAMTMGFELKDPAGAKALKVGDVVDFELAIATDGPMVTKIAKAVK